CRALSGIPRRALSLLRRLLSIRLLRRFLRPVRLGPLWLLSRLSRRTVQACARSAAPQPDPSAVQKISLRRFGCPACDLANVTHSGASRVILPSEGCIPHHKEHGTHWLGVNIISGQGQCQTHCKGETDEK